MCSVKMLALAVFMFNTEKEKKLVVTNYICIIKQKHSYREDCHSLALHTQFFFSLDWSKHKKRLKVITFLKVFFSHQRFGWNKRTGRRRWASRCEQEWEEVLSVSDKKGREWRRDEKRTNEGRGGKNIYIEKCRVMFPHWCFHCLPSSLALCPSANICPP